MICNNLISWIFSPKIRIDSSNVIIKIYENSLNSSKPLNHVSKCKTSVEQKISWKFSELLISKKLNPK